VPNVTDILIAARAEPGPAAIERLTEALYPELRRLAAALMRRERSGHTLQPTALVGEAFIRLVDQTRIEWHDQAHFLKIAARVMRQVLVDHARRRGAIKRGQPAHRITFDEDRGHGARIDWKLLDLDAALERLEAIDARAARVAELRLFGGLTVPEAARVLDLSKRTVDSDWAMARLWLARELR
jgi:RNA polymerase sigma factor (TIGR02999 family)